MYIEVVVLHLNEIFDKPLNNKERIDEKHDSSILSKMYCQVTLISLILQVFLQIRIRRIGLQGEGRRIIIHCLCQFHNRNP